MNNQKFAINVCMGVFLNDEEKEVASIRNYLSIYLAEIIQIDLTLLRIFCVILLSFSRALYGSFILFRQTKGIVLPDQFILNSSTCCR